jgi:hypothetical protein
VAPRIVLDGLSYGEHRAQITGSGTPSAWWAAI